MPDRRVREPSQAILQHIERLTADVRNLKLRAYRGAVRTAHTESVAPGVYDEFVTVLEVIVSSGRWLVSGLATFTTAAPVSGVDLRLQIGAYDPITDEPVTVSHDDVPPCEFAISTTSPVTYTAQCVGDIIAEDNVKMVLQSANFAGGAYTLSHIRLTLSPV